MKREKHGQALADPFAGADPEEVPLPRAPLVSVVSQVRFLSPELSIENPAEVAPLQAAVREQYPRLEEERVQPFPAGRATGAPATIWRFVDDTGSWRAAVARKFVALDTSAYDRRRHFLERLHGLLRAVEETIGPRDVERVGLRYIDRLEASALEQISGFIRPELLGLLAGPLGGRVTRGLAEAELSVEGDDWRLRARWGVLPANATIDPALVDPLDRPSWILDIDAFHTGRQPFAAEGLARVSEKLAGMAYRFFRWVVTDRFLEYCGGQP